ncbi:unnamed protein product, partial [Sphacelaria rigidula]
VEVGVPAAAGAGDSGWDRGEPSEVEVPLARLSEPHIVFWREECPQVRSTRGLMRALHALNAGSRPGCGQDGLSRRHHIRYRAGGKARSYRK